MSLIGKKYVLLAHMHMYYKLVSLLLLTYVVYLGIYLEKKVVWALAWSKFL